jgi:hypothetical protein
MSTPTRQRRSRGGAALRPVQAAELADHFPAEAPGWVDTDLAHDSRGVGPIPIPPLGAGRPIHLNGGGRFH